MENQNTELEIIEDSYEMETTVSNDGNNETFILEYPDYFDKEVTILH